jgi:hypothetical protein
MSTAVVVSTRDLRAPDQPAPAEAVATPPGCPAPIDHADVTAA